LLIASIAAILLGAKTMWQVYPAFFTSMILYLFIYFYEKGTEKKSKAINDNMNKPMMIS
jgi:hypothetical protein